MNSAANQTAMAITVIGMNPRGAAMARTLAQAGNVVTAWAPERSPDLALVADGVRVADSPETGLTTSALVVLCVEDYGALSPVLDRIGPLLASHDVVNLTSGTSTQAQEAASAFSAHGGRYLDGALMAHPEHLGDPNTVLVYSGSADVFQRNEKTLSQLGSATYLGTDPGTASLYDLAMLDFAWATLVGYLHTATLLATAEVRAESVTPLLTRWLKTTVVDVIENYARQIDAGEYPGDGEWLELDAPLMRHLVQATEERGLDPGLPRMIESLTARGIAAGFGKQSFASLVEIIRR